MNLKEIFPRLTPVGTVDLSALFFSSKYPMNQVSRYFDASTGNAIDVTKTVAGRRMYRQTSKPEGNSVLASFEGARWLEESA